MLEKAPDFMDRINLSKRLGITTRRIAGMVEEKKFPAPFIVGNQEMWRKSDVLAWERTLVDSNGMRLGERGRLPWDNNPNMPIALVELPELVLSFPECRFGVYLLLVGEKVMYVGQSINLPGRIGAHRKTAQKTPERRHEREFYVPLERHELLEIENRLIRLFRPPWNIVSNPAVVEALAEVPD